MCKSRISNDRFFTPGWALLYYSCSLINDCMNFHWAQNREDLEKELKKIFGKNYRITTDYIIEDSSELFR